MNFNSNLTNMTYSLKYMYKYSNITPEHFQCIDLALVNMTEFVSRSMELKYISYILFTE